MDGVLHGYAQCTYSPKTHSEAELLCTQARRQYHRMLRRALIFTAIGTTAVLGGYFAYKLYKSEAEKREGSSDGMVAASAEAAAKEAPQFTTD
jgi:hypothetical protein